MEYIAFDAHKRYTQVSVEAVDGERRYEGRIAHAAAASGSRRRSLSSRRTAGGRRSASWNSLTS
jgi:hypothetical protein